MQALSRLSGIVLVATSVAVLAGCASSGKKTAKSEDKPIEVRVEAPLAEKDSLGNYRFMMQQGEQKMSADQFDAWMKANGIRVAKGAGAPAAAAAPAKKN
ncbi:hypothetical protein [Stenotrophomonas pigmentata]|uniref:hypothetical protein n=1 Tax=Stenotrophomonas pigmentata TaxID=3055080 RepID=UPI0026EBE7B7|nr:hypothetical protein [Stenotrophomonas sp. 610A2]